MMSYCTRSNAKDGKCVGNQAVCSGSPVCWEAEVDMYDGMYPAAVYAYKANDWLIKAETTVSSQGLEVHASASKVRRSMPCWPKSHVRGRRNDVLGRYGRVGCPMP